MFPLAAFRSLLILALLASTCQAIKVQWKKEVDSHLVLPPRLHLPSRTTKAHRQLPSGSTGQLVPGTQAQGTVAAYAGPQANRRRQESSVGYFSGSSVVPYSQLNHIYCANGTDYPPIEDCPLQYFEFTVPESATDLISIQQSGEYVYQNSLPLNLGLQGEYDYMSGWNETTNESIPFNCSLGPGSTIYVQPALVNFYSTPVDSPPYYDGDAWLETVIWNIDPNTGVLGVNWVNMDGSFPDVYMVYNPSTGGIYVTGDVSLLETTLGVSLELITLVFSLGQPTTVST